MPNPILDQQRVSFLKSRSRLNPILVPAWPRYDKELPQVELDVNWVRFSTMNHRTRAEQMREVHTTGNPSLFTSDPLGTAAQDAQYRILTGQEGFDQLKADLKERGQQEPAIVTAEGILINGNRRSAALRNLFSDDTHLRAQYVKCLILPEDATIAELVDLEAELQVARDFREDYSWINEALLIEELYDRENKDFDRVAARMHRDSGDVRSLHDKLQQVHQLVALSNGAKLHIDFRDNESAFDELAKHIRNKSPAEAESVRSTYFLGTIAGVNYRKLRHLRRSDAAQLVRQEIDSDPTLSPILTSIIPAAPALVDDPLDDILGSAGPQSSLNDILSFFATKRPEEAVAISSGETVTIRDILGTLQGAINLAADEAEEEARDQTAVDAPLTRSDRAIQELERVLSALPRARNFPEWDEGRFQLKVAELKALLNALDSTP
jgi:hypothetical protein